MQEEIFDIFLQNFFEMTTSVPQGSLDTNYEGVHNRIDIVDMRVRPFESH